MDLWLLCILLCVNNVVAWLCSHVQCPRLAVVQKQLQEQPAYQEYLQAIKPVQQAFQQIFNTSAIPPLSGILDALRARRCHGVL